MIRPNNHDNNSENITKRKRGFEPCTLKPFKTHHHLCVKLHKPGIFCMGMDTMKSSEFLSEKKSSYHPLKSKVEITSEDSFMSVDFLLYDLFGWRQERVFCLFNQRDAFYSPMWVNKYSLQQSAEQILFIFRAVNVNNVWPSLDVRRREINKSNQTRLKWQLHLLSHRIWKCKQ